VSVIPGRAKGRAPVRTPRAAVALALVGALGGGFLAPVAGAQPANAPDRPHGLMVSFHLHCFSGVEAADQRRMEYWNPGLARHNADPDCVARQPLMGPLPLRAVEHAWHPETVTERVRLHVDPGYRPAIARITAAHRGQVIAVAINGRLLTTIWLTGPLDGETIDIHAAERKAGVDLARDLHDLMRTPLRP
jgi:hypothetical protein